MKRLIACLGCFLLLTGLAVLVCRVRRPSLLEGPFEDVERATYNRLCAIDGEIAVTLVQAETSGLTNTTVAEAVSKRGRNPFQCSFPYGSEWVRVNPETRLWRDQRLSPDEIALYTLYRYDPKDSNRVVIVARTFRGVRTNLITPPPWMPVDITTGGSDGTSHNH
jgi:hypothetical protein